MTEKKSGKVGTWLRRANSSHWARVMPNCAASFSAVFAIGILQKESVRVSQSESLRGKSLGNLVPQRALRKQ